MGRIFGGGRKPDQALLDAQQRQLDSANARAAKLEKQESARDRARKGRARGRDLLMYSDETGSGDTLG